MPSISEFYELSVYTYNNGREHSPLHFHVLYSDYGMRDTYANDFINGAISVHQLGSAMRLGKLGLQYVLKSERAFDRIRFEGYEIAASAAWYAKKAARDIKARHDYFDSRKNRRELGGLFIT